MKQRKKTKQAQIELFCDLKLISDPIPLELPADRQEELKKAVAELLLTLALDNAEIGKEAEHDA